MTLSKNYCEERRQRLADAVNDYFLDDKTSPETFYEDLMNELNTIHTYHSKIVNTVERVYSLFKDDSVEQELKERELEFTDDVNSNSSFYNKNHPDFYDEYLKFVNSNRF